MNLKNMLGIERIVRYYDRILSERQRKKFFYKNSTVQLSSKYE